MTCSIFRAALPMAAACLLAVPASAWELKQGNGVAVTTQADGRYTVMLRCRRGGEFELSILDNQLRGDEFEGVESLMMWTQLPDGRTDRLPIFPVYQEGSALSGQLTPNGVTLDFFRNGSKFEVDSPQTRKTFVSTGMKGSGAARLAFLEQCGI